MMQLSMSVLPWVIVLENGNSVLFFCVI